MQRNIVMLTPLITSLRPQPQPDVTRHDHL